MKRDLEESNTEVHTDKVKKVKKDKEHKHKSKKEHKDKDHKKKEHKDKDHKTKDKKEKKHKHKEASKDVEDAKDAEENIEGNLKDKPASSDSSMSVSSNSFYEENQVHIENSDLIAPIVSFDQIELHPSLESVKKFDKPTPIQSVSWPYLLQGKDVIGVAETGSGKTLAFGVPGLNNLLNNPSSDIKMLCVSPTRELAIQIYDSLKQYNKKVKINCIYGGVSKQDQISSLPGSNIVIATPGRLLDLINDEYLDLSHVNYLVLDEADRMLDQGFEKDILSIISRLPTKRQTLMFTATWPIEVEKLASKFLKNPVKITLGNISNELNANKRITQVVEVIKPFDKEKRLLQLLNQYVDKHDKILIFALYKKEASRVEQVLQRNRFSICSIHGDLNQSQRSKALNDFKAGNSQILLATDVAARGLDIPNVTLVINLTFPLTVEDYVHRIGRTGRAGKTGLAHTLFTEHEKHLSGALCNILRGADQEVPEDLLKFGGHTKKKAHSAYGAFFKDVDMSKTAKKIKFD